MITVHTVQELQKAIATYVAEARSVGFVPTMGALHQGHISLVEECCEQNDICVVSIFVNPTQFNNPLDLEKYPRTIEQDIQMLEEAQTDIVFIPSVEEIYPEPDTRQFDFGQLDQVMEGKFRPGHFNGVAQVVSRLFEIVKPDRAYFGEKDFQQLAVIREMIRQLHILVEIVPMPIRREDSGLAMSSRNQRLSEDQKQQATHIYRILAESKERSKQADVETTRKWVVDSINSTEGLLIEYFEIVDGNTLQQITDWKETTYAVGCITVFCGDVRLIDNMVYYS